MTPERAHKIRECWKRVRNYAIPSQGNAYHAVLNESFYLPFKPLPPSVDNVPNETFETVIFVKYNSTIECEGIVVETWKPKR